MTDDDPKTAREVVAEERDVPIEEVSEDAGAAEVLAAMTGEPKEEFEPDLEEHPFPELDDLERVPADV